MLDKKNILIVRAAMAIDAVLLFINSAAANINGFSGVFEILIASQDIIAVAKIKTLARNNRLDDICIAKTVKYALAFLIFRIRPKQHGRIILGDPAPHEGISHIEKIAARVNSNDLDILGCDLCIDRVFRPGHVITGEHSPHGQAILYGLIAKVASHGIAAGAFARARSAHGHAVSVHIDVKINVCRKRAEVPDAFPDLTVTVDQRRIDKAERTFQLAVDNVDPVLFINLFFSQLFQVVLHHFIYNRISYT